MPKNLSSNRLQSDRLPLKALDLLQSGQHRVLDLMEKIGMQRVGENRNPETAAICQYDYAITMEQYRRSLP